MNNIKLLDCTLRDGAYIVNAEFGTSVIKGMIKKLQDANIEIIECGWLKNTEHQQGTTFYHTPLDLEQYLLNKCSHSLYVAMIDWNRYDLNYLPEYDGKSIDAIRVVFPYGRHREAVEIGKAIKTKGYQVFFQAANTLAYSDEDLKDLAKEVNKLKPSGLSIVDTFGAMYEEDLKRIVSILDCHVDSEIALGFHSHNNQQLSFALTVQFVEQLREKERTVIVDSSLCGMGRGAGNATTELVSNYLNKKCFGKYDLDYIMDAIDMYVEPFHSKYTWGYSIPYFIAGMYCCHVNNIAYLQNNHRINSKDMRSVIESLSADDRKKYDYDLLERKYIENQDRVVDDAEALKQLQEELGSRTVLLIAPGKAAIKEQEMIKTYIKEHNPVVIAVNAFIKGYQYDYFFVMNSVRYAYSKDAYSEEFEKTKRIVLSNIKTEQDEGELIINFNHVIKRGWPHFDNAVINCLRLMDILHVSKVAIAGFDGFKQQYMESYADPTIPPINSDNEWGTLNEEIRDMYLDFRKVTETTMDIQFITESIFEE